MMRTLRALPFLTDAPRIHLHDRRVGGGHVLLRRCKQEIDTALLGQSRIMVESAWISREIFVGPELKWIDEDAHHHDVPHPPRLVYELEVTFVQGPHRWHERDALAVSTRVRDATSHLGDRFNLLHLETVRGVRVRSASHITGPGSDCCTDVLRHLRVALQKFWIELVVEAEHVGQHKDLAVAVRAGANANRWDGDRFGDVRADRRGHQLEHHRKGSRPFKPFVFVDQSLPSRSFTSLNSCSANRIYRLRCKADVRHYGNPRTYQRVHGIEHLRTPA